MTAIRSSDSENLRRPTGRPRRLTLRQVVDAAMEIGLENMSIGAVAARLGVSLGTIYTYVENRDELCRLVAVTMSKRQLIDDRGQHWAEIIRKTAADTFRVMSGEPELLAMVVLGATEGDEGLVELEHLIAMLVERGFSERSAFELYRSAAQVVAGAAVVTATARSWERKGETRRVRLATAFAHAAPDDFPHVKALGDVFTVDMEYLDYRPAIERLLAQFAFERGEALPPPIEGADESKEA